MKKEHWGNTLSGTLFVAGTSIGAGMLALPFATGVAGFVPAVVITIISWAFMFCTGLLFLEVTLWMPDGANVLSMSRRFLGMPGRIIGGAAFLYLYYSLLVAYFSAGTPILSEAIHQIFGFQLEPREGLVLFTLIFGFVIWLGAWITDRLNYILMAGLILSYIAMLGTGAKEIRFELLTHQEWPLAFLAVPTVWAAFGYHNIVPSITTYLHRNSRKLRWAIFLGTLIPLIVYGCWQLIVIGSVPPEVITSTLEKGQPITHSLGVKSAWFTGFARYFALFAIVTSVLGVALSMVDFLGDGTKIPRKGWGRAALCLLVFVPPFVFTWKTPHLFFSALHWAGVYGEAVLNGLLPILMVWVGRYAFKLKSDYRLPGGRWTLSILLALTLLIIIFETARLF
jgi:tyrosine-specific transport protein